MTEVSTPERISYGRTEAPTQKCQFAVARKRCGAQAFNRIDFHEGGIIAKRPRFIQHRSRFLCHRHHATLIDLFDPHSVGIEMEALIND